MDGTADDELSDELADELLDLTRRLRGQLLRHAALGAWAAPGGPSARAAAGLAGAPAEAEHLEDDAAAFALASGGGDPTSASLPSPRGGPPAAIAEPASSRFEGHRVPVAARAASLPELPEGPETAGDAPVLALGRRTLAEVRDELGDCTRCKLHETRRSIVFGVGAGDAPLMFVGEAPGEQEDRRGEPFVGPAGQLLDKMIEAMGWTRATVYIANTTKCRPPGNRNPQPDEHERCMPFLHAQIAAIAPRIIVALGRPAANQLLGIDAPISALRGQFHDYARATADGVRPKIMPTFHPAYLLRDPDKKRAAWADLKLVMAELARLGIAAPSPAPP